METKENKYSIFENGTTWLRADFHLHTKADSVFIYTDDPNYFATNYIQQLVTQHIRIGLITNHNKFDLTEFKELRKVGLKNEVFLIPGIEFSIKDGAKGLHILIAFHDSWLYNSENKNFIQEFITTAFTGITGYDNKPYKNSKFSFSETCQQLDEFGKDYFIIMAHVDDSSGLFNELEGRGLDDFINHESFSKRVVALQKVRSIENQKKVKAILGNDVPINVEGSDNAENGINGIGTGNEVKGVCQSTFLKVGDFSFDAIKYALLDHVFRVKPEKPNHSRAYLKSISFKSKRLGERKLFLSPSMNNLIGIRGSGKSSILETIRYALDINLPKKGNVDNYKENIVKVLLGSGGEMTLELVDSHGKVFIAKKRIEETTNIYLDGVLQQNLKTNAIINKPLYFGQKDLSDLGSETATEDLIDRLISDKTKDIKQQCEAKITRINTILLEIQKLQKSIDSKPDIESHKAATELKLTEFIKHKVNEKLNKQIEFNKDSSRIDLLINHDETILSELKELFANYKDSFNSLANYESKENKTLFVEILGSFEKFKETFLALEKLIPALQTEINNLKSGKQKFSLTYEALKEEFAEIKRTINIPNIDADAYVKLSKELEVDKIRLSEIEKVHEKQIIFRKELDNALVDLKNLWHKEYELIKEEIDNINNDQKAIKIEVDYKGNKEKFKDFLKEIVKGSSLQERLVIAITGEYKDLIEVFYDLNKQESTLKTILSGGDNYLRFKQKFTENLADCLTFRVPDKHSIFYKERPLSEHSLGQRASAIILFILSLKENDLIIIDQPEDDLDNQTIYSDVISELNKLKDKTQFIFATHNPNIPVLGDCEQVFACEFVKTESNEIIETTVGSIDNDNVQKKIVEIMEGGQDAFNHRKLIYELWKH